MNPEFSTQLLQNNSTPPTSNLTHSLLYAPYPRSTQQPVKRAPKNSKRSIKTTVPVNPPTLPIPTTIPMPAMPIPAEKPVPNMPIPMMPPPLIPPGYPPYPYPPFPPYPYPPFYLQPIFPIFPPFPIIHPPIQFPPTPISTYQPSKPAPVLTPVLEVVEADDSPKIEPMKLDVPPTGMDSSLLIEYMNSQVDKLESFRNANVPSGTFSDKSIDSGYTSIVSPETITSPISAIPVSDFNTMRATVIHSPTDNFNSISVNNPITNALQTLSNAVISNIFPKETSSLWSALPLDSNLPVTSFNMANTNVVNQGTPIIPIETTAFQSMNMEDTVMNPPSESNVGIFDWDLIGKAEQRVIDKSDVQFQLELLYQAADNGSGPRLRIVEDHNPNTPLLRNEELFPSLRKSDGSEKPRVNISVTPDGNLDRIRKRPRLDPPATNYIDSHLPKNEKNYLYLKDRYQTFLFSKTVERMCHLQHNAILIQTILSLKKYGKQTAINYLDFCSLRWNEERKLKDINDAAGVSIEINLLLNAALLIAEIQSIKPYPAELQISVFTQLTLDTRKISAERKFPENYETVQQWLHQALESVPDIDKTTVELIRVALDRDCSFPKSQRRILEMVNETGVERSKLLRVWQQVHNNFQKKVDEEGFLYFLN